MAVMQAGLDPATEALADRLVACIAAGDAEGVAACFHDDAVEWHNDEYLDSAATAVLRV